MSSGASIQTDESKTVASAKGWTGAMENERMTDVDCELSKSKNAR